jgi:hypothetical protein
LISRFRLRLRLRLEILPGLPLTNGGRILPGHHCFI